MRVHPGESYADLVDWDAEEADRIERGVEFFEDEARECAEEYFCDHYAQSYLVLTELAEHPAVVDAVCAAINSPDESDLGKQLKRAVGYARIKWVEENWRRFALYRVNCGRSGRFPRTDAEIGEFRHDR